MNDGAKWFEVSDYSPGGNYPTCREMAENAAKNGAQALALADFETMSGLPAFEAACDAKGIHPILGCMFRLRKKQRDGEMRRIIVLAKNDEGYYNMTQLATYTGKHPGMGITTRMVNKYRQGLIVIEEPFNRDEFLCDEFFEQCTACIPRRPPDPPRIPLPEGFQSHDALLAHLVNNGIDALYGRGRDYNEIKARAGVELALISRHHLTNYFLIAADFAAWARNNDIPLGPAPGKEVCLLVCYALGISTIDPVRYHLPFENVVSEQSMFTSLGITTTEEGRNKIIAYITRKYRAQCVGYVAVYGRKRHEEKITHYESAGSLRPLRYVHPIDIILARKPLAEYIPLYASTMKHTYPVKREQRCANVSHYESHYLDRSGVLRYGIFAYLPFSNVQRICANIRKKVDDKKHFDITTILLDDTATWALLCAGDTDDIFGFQSDKMKTYLREAQPADIVELALILAYAKHENDENLVEFVKTKQSRIRETPYHLSWALIAYQEAYCKAHFREVWNESVKYFKGGEICP